MRFVNEEKHFGVLVAAVAVAMLLDLGFAAAAVNSETQRAATQMGASAVTEIKFSTDSTDLSDSAKAALRKLIIQASHKGTIKEVRIAVWADQEYPRKNASVADSQVDLAEARAEGVQAYLASNLNISSVRFINMAESPNDFQKLFKTPDAKIKNGLETSGAAPTRSDQTGFLGLKGKASEAVIMVYLR